MCGDTRACPVPPVRTAGFPSVRAISSSRMQLFGRPNGEYSKTPFLQRLPTAAAASLPLLVEAVVSHEHDVLEGLLIYAASCVGLLLVFHSVFRQPWARLLMYREYDER